MPDLNPKQLALLKAIVERAAPVPVSELDRRVLRPLRSQGFVAERGGFVSATSDGRVAARAAGQARVHDPITPSAPRVALSEGQEDALRLLCRRTQAVLAENIDGRTLRALSARGFAEEKHGWVAVTDAGRDHFRQFVRGREAARAQTPRARAIHKRVEELEAAFPADAEVMIGECPAYVDDIFLGLRRLAREFERVAE